MTRVPPDDPTSSFRLGDSQVKSECLRKWTLYKSVAHSFFLNYWSLLIPSVIDILHHSHHCSPPPAQGILSNQYPHSRYNLSQIIVITICEWAFNWKTVNDDAYLLRQLGSQWAWLIFTQCNVTKLDQLAMSPYWLLWVNFY